MNRVDAFCNLFRTLGSFGVLLVKWTHSLNKYSTKLFLYIYIIKYDILFTKFYKFTNDGATCTWGMQIDT